MAACVHNAGQRQTSGSQMLLANAGSPVTGALSTPMVPDNAAVCPIPAQDWRRSDGGGSGDFSDAACPVPIKNWRRDEEAAASPPPTSFLASGKLPMAADFGTKKASSLHATPERRVTAHVAHKSDLTAGVAACSAAAPAGIMSSSSLGQTATHRLQRVQSGPYAADCGVPSPPHAPPASTRLRHDEELRRKSFTALPGPAPPEKAPVMSSNLKELESLCASMDRAGIRIESIDIQDLGDEEAGGEGSCDPAAAAALALNFNAH